MPHWAAKLDVVVPSDPASSSSSSSSSSPSPSPRCGGGPGCGRKLMSTGGEGSCLCRRACAGRADVRPNTLTLPAGPWLGGPAAAPPGAGSAPTGPWLGGSEAASPGPGLTPSSASPGTPSARGTPRRRQPRGSKRLPPGPPGGSGPRRCPRDRHVLRRHAVAQHATVHPMAPNRASAKITT